MTIEIGYLYPYLYCKYLNYLHLNKFRLVFLGNSFFLDLKITIQYSLSQYIAQLKVIFEKNTGNL